MISSSYAIQLLNLTTLCLNQFKLCYTAAEVNYVVLISSNDAVQILMLTTLCLDQFQLWYTAIACNYDTLRRNHVTPA